MAVCSALWSHARMNVQGEVLPCCRWDADDNDVAPRIADGIQSALDSNYFNSIRERMLAGEELPECRQCTSEEINGTTSMREKLNGMYSQHIGKKPKLRYIELAFSTHCNLACRMCNETFSSKWKLINNPKLTVDTSVDAFDIEKYDIDLSELELIKVVGGEPFLSKNHYDYLDRFVTQSDKPENVTIIYHTNGTIFPNNKIIEYWKKLKRVHIAVSVDGYGKLNDYLRPGSSWETVNKTIEKFKNIEDVNITMGAHSVVTSLNVLQLPKLIEWTMQTFGSMGGFDVARYPEHLSIVHLSDKEKEKIRFGISLMREHVGDVEKTQSAFGILEDALNEDTDKKYTLKDIAQREEKLDKYFKQEFWDNIENV